MSNGQVDVQNFDEWLKDDSDVAALVMRQWLEPVEGEKGVIFPPTYAKAERMKEEEDWLGYNIDRFDDGSSVCQVDSVGSQANRMEPIFKRERYKHLVPQVIIKADNREVHLLDAGHRAADAIVRFSTLGPELHEAFQVYRDQGNAEQLARIAPTSIVFGSWDSRATQAKLPRIVRSVIRAYNIKQLHRSAQYSTIAGEILEGDAEVTTKGPKAQLGLAHVPAVLTHGGIQVLGEIRRDATLTFSALRALAGEKEHGTLALRRYILGLALVSFTAPAETCLREGCNLVPSQKHPPEWKLVKNEGTRENFQITHADAIVFATAVASAFGVNQNPVSGSFDSELANKVLTLSEADRKKLFKQGPVTKASIDQVLRRSARG
jgi:CRISPR-associated protein Csb1